MVYECKIWWNRIYIKCCILKNWFVLVGGFIRFCIKFFYESLIFLEIFYGFVYLVKVGGYIKFCVIL